ncbi:hypothetical protein GTC6_00425 [Gordonia terrae C-6]|uniref:Uncharacterized protein n=2 Tax=Gordoniaceae TaxID=85026 RepID=R7YFW7_9ACTN|nr:hypothetical protein GTC6_00425 [Gordonia terrae C-6]
MTLASSLLRQQGVTLASALLREQGVMLASSLLREQGVTLASSLLREQGVKLAPQAATTRATCFSATVPPSDGTTLGTRPRAGCAGRAGRPTREGLMAIDRDKSRAVSEVVREHPVMSLVAVSPGIAVFAALLLLDQTFLAILFLILAVGGGAYLLTRKR